MRRTVAAEGRRRFQESDGSTEGWKVKVQKPSKNQSIRSDGSENCECSGSTVSILRACMREVSQGATELQDGNTIING